jgi:integrase
MLVCILVILSAGSWGSSASFNNLRAAGADLKTVQETLGHADHKITADTYTSILTELERATAEAAANLIPRGGLGE